MTKTMTEATAVDSTVQSFKEFLLDQVLTPKTKWGEWEWRDSLTILYKNYYEIDLEQINSTAEMLDWFFQCSEKDIAGLTQAFQDIFHPQKNCCSWGCEKTFSGSKLAREYAKGLKPVRNKMSPKLRYSILQRDEFKCKACGVTPNEGAKLHVDHIHPVSLGGSDDPSNLQTLCSVCNIGKSNRI
jgi:hypothetical protein